MVVVMVFKAIVCVSLRCVKIFGFWNGTIGRVPRFQATRPVEIKRGTCAKGRRSKALPEAFGSNLFFVPMDDRFVLENTIRCGMFF